MTLQTKSIRFPEKVYVGMIAREADSQPLGFMTEWGTTAAALKRMQTVDGWVKSAYHKLKHAADFPTQVYDNKPMAGYRLGRSVRRDSGWGSGNVVWRIEDPRGFDLEISSPNMAQIIADCVLDRGEILDQCVWARLGGNNILVPLSSDLYQTTVENSERIKKSVKPSDVKMGNTVVLQNGRKGQYLGYMYCLETSYGYENNGWHNPRYHYDYNYDRVSSVFGKSYSWSDRKRHWFKFEEGGLEHLSALKVSEIVDHSEISQSDAERILDGRASFSQPDISEVRVSPKTYEEVVADRGHFLTHINGKDAVFWTYSEFRSGQEIAFTYVDRQSIFDQKPKYLTSEVLYGTSHIWPNVVQKTRTVVDQERIKFDPTLFSTLKFEKLFVEYTTALGNHSEISL